MLELRGSPLHTDTGLHPVRRLVERRCGISRLTGGPERLRLLEAELGSCGLDVASIVLAGAGTWRRSRARLSLRRCRRPNALRVDRRNSEAIRVGVHR